MISVLIQNAALLVTLSFLYGIIRWYRPQNELLYRTLNGVWFGLVAVAAMMMPYNYSPGIIYDGRSVIMTVAGLWGGGLTTLIAALIACTYRISLGGEGVWAGVATIVFTGITGLVFRQIFRKKIEKRGISILFGIGVAADIVMLASQLFLPNQPLHIIKEIWLPILLIFTVAFVFISKLFQLIDGYINGYRRIAIEEELYRERELWLRESQRIGNIGSYILNIKTNHWTSSEVLDEIFGITDEDPHTVESWNMIIHPDQQKEMLDYFLNNVVKERKPFEKEYRIIRKNDGAERWVAGHGELQFDEKGEPVRMIGTIQDITEKKQILNDLIVAKEKAEESEQLKSAFLANMSHEIRTPLNAIVGFTNLLTSNNKSFTNKNRQEFAQLINKSTEGLLKIINDILDFSRLESGNVVVEQKPLEVNKLLSSLNMLFEKVVLNSEKNKIQLSLEKAEFPVIIHSDENRIIQIFSNLLDNAIRFTPQGKVKFGVSAITEDYIEFFVSDTGIGIGKEKQEIIFDRFIQSDSGISRSYGGTGLGLAIVKKLTELMGSEIVLESEPGKGSRFSFRLPYTLPENNIEKKTVVNITDKQKTMDQNKKILIVEDDEASIQYFKHALQNEYELLFYAKTGNEALQLHKSESPDFILMDIGLPDMNGLDVVRKIRGNDKKVIIIAQTAFAMSGDDAKALEAGCNDYITKPVSRDLLLKKLKAN